MVLVKMRIAAARSRRIDAGERYKAMEGRLPKSCLFEGGPARAAGGLFKRRKIFFGGKRD
jgi:hypothetical protein